MCQNLICSLWYVPNVNLENLLAVELIELGSHLASTRTDENLTRIDEQNIFKLNKIDFEML